MCALAGLTPPARVDGKSLVPVLRGETTTLREVAFTRFAGEQFDLRDARWKLIRYPLHDRVEFFDL